MNSTRLIGFEELPQEIRGQLDGITERWKRQLVDRLVGLYLHGSIALRAFRPELGDLDLVAVVRVSLQRFPESNVLILGRILSFKMEKKILSKYDAGLWMMRNLPTEFTEWIENAMKIWYEGKTCTLPEKELEKLRLCLIEKIKK